MAMASLLLLLPVFASISTFTLIVHSAPPPALVSSLPGFSGPFPSLHYSGYITVDEAHGRQLYYYFVTSEANPSTDPVILWMNGGPGCSSFDAFIYEHGPFNFDANETPGSLPNLKINPYTWTKVASIIYLDSPAGVGFSYSNTTADYVTGDLKTAVDVHTFILKWFNEYSEFLSNPFYVAGESYGGIYVPTVTQEIADGIDKGVLPIINLKGYMIGNGVTDEEFDGNALVPFVHGMGLISNQLYEEVQLLCNRSYWKSTNADCESKLGAVNNDISKLNMYDILEPCYHESVLQETLVDLHGLPKSFKRLGETKRSLPTRRRMFGRAWPLFLSVRAGHVPTWPQLGLLKSYVPCLDTHISSLWLNSPSVRKAVHASPEELIGKWLICSDLIDYTSDAGSMLPYHRNLLERGYRALIFSGDHDMCVPYTGSEAWTRSMGYSVVDDWRPWFLDEQVAGFTISYSKNLTFATIKGSGHTVPEYKPEEALCFVERWLVGEAL